MARIITFGETALRVADISGLRYRQTERSSAKLDVFLRGGQTEVYQGETVAISALWNLLLGELEGDE